MGDRDLPTGGPFSYPQFSIFFGHSLPFDSFRIHTSWVLLPPKSRSVRQNSKPRKRRWPKREKRSKEMLDFKLFLSATPSTFLWLPITPLHLVSSNLLTTSYSSGFHISWERSSILSQPISSPYFTLSV